MNDHKYETDELLDQLQQQSNKILELEERCKHTENAAKKSETKSHLLFQFAPIAMIERDASELRKYIDRLRATGIIDLKEYLTENPHEVFHCLKLIKTVDYNKAYLKLLEAENIEEVYKSTAKGTPDEFLSFAKDIIMMIAEGTVWEEREEYLTTVKGNRRSVLGKSLIISGHEDTLSSVIMTLTDITKLKEAQEALQESEQRYRQQSLRDNLTGLYNRRYLYSSLSKLIETSKVDDMDLSVLFIDLDNFKQVVDTYGHLNGSLAIQEIATTIQGCLEEPAYAVSYAGDEFIVVLPAADNVRANEKASEISLRISNRNYLNSQGIQAKLSASFGIATFPDHGSDLTDLLASADKALFEAKRNCKGAVRNAKK